MVHKFSLQNRVLGAAEMKHQTTCGKAAAPRTSSMQKSCCCWAERCSKQHSTITKTSSYAFFVQTCREEHKKKNPGTSVNFAEFSKKCSERWRTMSSKEKGKFEEMAKTDKVRYDREMKNYVPPKGAKGGKKKKDPNAPKRPPSAFFVFCSDHRPKVKSDHPGISIGDIAKKLGEMWSKLSPKEKSPYEQKAMKLKEKYVQGLRENKTFELDLQRPRLDDQYSYNGWSRYCWHIYSGDLLPQVSMLQKQASASGKVRGEACTRLGDAKELFIPSAQEKPYRPWGARPKTRKY
ncbi:high mobility group protein 1 homolog [Danio aesculapii]|uniref:high mobility group protein 1 homolog n=1 Tax=Danio aesculapii TaxID=1142201 RepID=UPI0024BF1837|nr:high mobility group protein 1 homolog [Danio aesculapii]